MLFTGRSLSAWAVLCAFSACRNRDFHEASPQEFRAAPRVVEEREKTFELARLKRLAPEISYRVYEDKLATSDYPRVSLRVVFGRLTEAQCNKVRKIYADSWQDGLSGVDCAKAAGRNFELVDFLTPAMQATSQLAFESEQTRTQRPLSAEERAFLQDAVLQSGYGALDPDAAFRVNRVLAANCWGTAFEILRRSSTAFSVFYEGGGDAIDKYFSDNTSLIAERRLDVPFSQELVGRFAFGDVILFHAAEDGLKRLMHAAVLVDENLLFEKIGAGFEDVYRLAAYDPFAVQTRRPGWETVRRAREVFPHILSSGVPMRFSYDTPSGRYVTEMPVRDYTLTKSESGRYALREVVAAAPSESSHCVVTSADGQTNLRADDTNTGKILAAIRNGTSLPIASVGMRNAVRLTGFVHRSVTECATRTCTDSTRTKDPQPSRSGEISGPNMRIEPGGAVIAVVANGTPLKVLRQGEQGWLAVELEGTVAKSGCATQ